MKRAFSILAIVCLFSVPSQTGFSQGTFQNLGFEQATIVPTGGENSSFYIIAANALPNWTAYINNSTIDWIVHNTISLSGAAISIHDSASSMSPLQGNYSVYLQGSSVFISLTSFSCTNRIGACRLSISAFRAWGDNFQVSVNGQSLSLVPMSSTGNYTVYGADIISFAGSSGELRFTALPTGNLFFDSIQFSASPVPEPSTLALTGIGALLLAAFCRRKSPLR